MVRERLQAWMKEQGNDKLPQSIIYYRDGVGTGQYDTIKRVEVTAIHAAYSKLAKEQGLPETVNVHAVFVVKRHHTRFYPLKESEGDAFGNHNTHPGTSVDRLVTSPYYQDFYLQSHSGIKGTAKPTHYFVLEDGVPGLTLEKLRDLTHEICYTYARALCAVSYASPTYYADRLCDRGRMYIRKYFVKNDKALGEELQQKEKELRVDKENVRNALIESDPKIEKKDWKSKKKEQEKKDWKDIKKKLAELVFERVKKDFYMFEEQGRMNPWDASLDDTMFWM
jgi:eukaryotic translation initiation factor 2C